MGRESASSQCDHTSTVLTALLFVQEPIPFTHRVILFLKNETPFFVGIFTLLNEIFSHMYTEVVNF